MASASSSDGVAGRIQNASLVLVSDNSSTLADIRKAVAMMKNIAVQLEKENQTDKVKDLENSVAELLDLYSDCNIRSSAIQSVANGYQPGEQLTDFKKLLDDEFTKLKATPSSVPQNDHLMRQFREAVWNVHHAGEPMPGDDEEDIVMTSTQCPLLNMTCPLSGKPVTELADPVRSMDCRHVYEKAVILHYIVNNPNGNCPVAGCRGKLQNSKVICDAMLKFEIEEMRSLNKQSNRAEVIEDFTEDLDED
ncbi:Zinc finger MIZ-type [Arabidopsis thaliana x Arabidopsis arenosa]|uniref:Zinc finger MIZ-type n=1 Tax=Arabidopsis thaliana x Arabidopsis arenosa TaxID=1240361 RepID=A0A8T2AUL2_9BRAS|nr:Zinc finger MIZ-type [Arabidopsis thaliana x Arabidopsis arenosa]